MVPFIILKLNRSCSIFVGLRFLVVDMALPLDAVDDETEEPF
jgi:hypothetical protein